MVAIFAPLNVHTTPFMLFHSLHSNVPHPLDTLEKVIMLGGVAGQHFGREYCKLLGDCEMFDHICKPSRLYRDCTAFEACVPLSRCM